ncbi:PH domain-containing protein [Bacillus sp. CLL-7-23]|uniref:PH domain-containing protein n=1 Tax=Bacillus changyiensis TaxID=3004103 RepID=A0ABT4WZD5_9BACI|nr:PH domain-containing protein [Bacillus changyiensis]MDA7025404.1 PH domain-containing protein [Bacillus changyiensis]
MLAATDKRLLFYSSLLASSFYLNIDYKTISSFRYKKGLVGGDHLIIMNDGNQEEFIYMDGCDRLQTFLKVIQATNQLSEDCLHL